MPLSVGTNCYLVKILPPMEQFNGRPVVIDHGPLPCPECDQEGYFVHGQWMPPFISLMVHRYQLKPFDSPDREGTPDPVVKPVPQPEEV